MEPLRESLDSLYLKLNRRRFVHPDPLEFLYRYDSAQDQEIAGLVSACLAYGRVAQILSSVGRVLDPMGESPRGFLDGTPEADISSIFAGFVHRFTSGRELAALLIGVKRALSRYGSLEELFRRGQGAGDETILPALSAFVAGLRVLSESGCPSLMPSPQDGSACKRLNLYLRWMARADAVDPGPWKKVSAARLVVPLDTHMHRISRALGLTKRKQADLKTALEVTRAFRELRPPDPVRYDFALTRLGIRKDCAENPFSRAMEGNISRYRGPREPCGQETPS